MSDCGLLQAPHPGSRRRKADHEPCHPSPASASSSPGSPAWSADRWPHASRADNTVFGAARFADPASASAHEAAGVSTDPRRPRARPSFDEVPDDLDYVLHFAVARPTTGTATSPPTSTASRSSWSGARASTPSSSAAPGGVYESQGQTPLKEDAAARRQPPRRRVSDATRSARSRRSRSCSTPRRGSTCPTVIARLSVPYGDTFGWPSFQRDDDRARHPDRRAPRRAVAVRPAAPRRHRGRRSPTCSRRRRCPRRS